MEIARENSERANELNRTGRFTMTVFNAEGQPHLHSGVSREDARALMEAGATFEGADLRKP